MDITDKLLERFISGKLPFFKTLDLIHVVYRNAELRRRVWEIIAATADEGTRHERERIDQELREFERLLWAALCGESEQLDAGAGTPPRGEKPGESSD